MLKTENISCQVGGVRVLDGVNLHVEPGKLHGLIGPNGAGKTTLLRVILGLQKTVSGSVTCSAQGIGYVPQRHEFAWDFPISVFDTVLTAFTGRRGFFRRPSVTEFHAAKHALELTDMAKFANRPVGQLSGGQRQRVLVARALATGSDLLLLDEPFTGLDLPTAEQLQELFGTLVANGTTILMTTHDLLTANADCHKLHLLNRSIVASGTPAEVAAQQGWQRAFQMQPQHPLLAALHAQTGGADA